MSQEPQRPDLSIGPAQKLARDYRDAPKLRGIIEGVGSFVPLLTGVNTYLIERLNKLERERTESLFRYLDESGCVLTPDLIESDTFLHCFAITIRAAQRTHRQEKIRLFAQLLISAMDGANFADSDEYDELLQLLDEMTFREIQVLALLDRTRQDSASDAFKELVARAARVPIDEVPALYLLTCA